VAPKCQAIWNTISLEPTPVREATPNDAALFHEFIASGFHPAGPVAKGGSGHLFSLGFPSRGRGDRILFTQVYGKANRHDHQPVTPQSLFRVASVSKPFTSAGIFSLVEAGKNYAYSNFGYYLLGRVIEKLSGIPYGEYVRQHVQTPLGITDMRLATETPAAGFLMHRHDGMAWAVLVNTRREHSRMEKDLHQLSWDIARALQT